jgi:hypothetical protein
MSRLVSPSSETKPFHDIIMATPEFGNDASTTRSSKLVGYDPPCDFATTGGSTSKNVVRSGPNDQFSQYPPAAPEEVYMPSSSDYLRTAVLSPSRNSTRNHDLTAVNQAENWSQGNLTSQRLDEFAATILPSSVQIQLAQTFGKDSINHLF